MIVKGQEYVQAKYSERAQLALGATPLDSAIPFATKRGFFTLKMQTAGLKPMFTGWVDYPLVHVWPEPNQIEKTDPLHAGETYP